MMHYSIILIFLLFSSSIVAGYRSQSAKVIAELKEQGGYLLPDYPLSQGIRIFDSGKVIPFEDDRELEEIASIKDFKMRQIITLVNQLKPGKLLDSDPNRPVCADLPMQTYSIAHADQLPIVIHEVKDCHDFEVAQSGVAGLKELLDGFRALSTLPH